MAHWDDEKFNTQDPPKDIMCATCVYRLKPVTVQGHEIDRSRYAACDMYKAKPNDIVWGRIPCDLYKKEE